VHSLQKLHTFGLPAYCRSIKVIHTLTEAEAFAKLNGSERFLLIGSGSNCAFINDFDGLVAQVRIKGIDVEESDDAFHLTVGAGENWHQFVSWTLDNQMNGLENLALIPGTVGAAPIQNIGAYGAEVSSFIQWVEYREIGTGQLIRLDNSACKFDYRESIFKLSLKGKALITRVCFSLPKDWHPNVSYAELKTLDRPSAKTIFDTVIEVRKSKLPDPSVQGNAGSFFKNPVVAQSVIERLRQSFEQVPCFELPDAKAKLPAAWLIDKLGYKGRCYGGIMCHKQQPLVLVNQDPNKATGEQLLAFASEIQTEVAKHFNIHLVPEVQLIGQNGLINL
jgi:UDP-N-acetylmuramate dehydrogenase